MLVAKDAEKEVLAAMLIEPQLNIYIDALTEDDFIDSQNRELFKVMKSIKDSKQIPDIVTVGLESPKLVPYVTQITGEVFTASFEQCLDIVKSATIMRKIYNTATEVRKMAEEETDAVKVVAWALEKIKEAVPECRGNQKFFDVVVKTINEIEHRVKNGVEREFEIKSLKKFNEITSGFYRGELSIIAARPSVGKTAFALQLAEDIAKSGKKVLIFSREMTKKQLIERLLARAANISHWEMRTGKLNDEKLSRLSIFGLEMAKLPIEIDTESTTIEDIRLKACSSEEVDIIIVDYLQLVESKKRFDVRNLEVGYISRQLKTLAIELNIPIIALSQLNRDAADTEPGLENLAESSKLEQDADNIYFLHRPEEQDLWEQHKLLYIDIIAAKQRQAPIGRTRVIFNPDKQKFYDIEKNREGM